MPHHPALSSSQHPPPESFTARSLVGGAFELVERIRRSQPTRGAWWPQDIALEGLGAVTAMAMEHGNAPQLVDFCLFKFTWPAEHLAISLIASNKGELHAVQAFQRSLSTSTQGEKHYILGDRYVFQKPASHRNNSWVEEKVAYRWKLDNLAMTSSAFHSITRQLFFRSVSNGAHCQITVTDVAATRILALSNLMIAAKKLERHPGTLQDCLTAGEALLVLVTLEQLRPVTSADGHQWDEAVSKIFPNEAAYLRVTGDEVRFYLLDFYTIHAGEITQAYIGEAGAGIVPMFEKAASEAVQVHVMQFLERPYPHHLVNARSLSKASPSSAFTPLSRSSFSLVSSVLHNEDTAMQAAATKLRLRTSHQAAPEGRAGGKASGHSSFRFSPLSDGCDNFTASFSTGLHLGRTARRGGRAGNNLSWKKRTKTASSSPFPFSGHSASCLNVEATLSTRGEAPQNEARCC